MPRDRYRVKVAKAPRVKPMMVWDGDCAFCGKWIRRWEEATDDAVEYVPYQKVADRFPEIGEAQFQEAVHFIGLDGKAVRGAEAVFSCLAFAGRYRFLLGLYQRLSWFAVLTTLLYGFVAKRRSFFSKLTTFFWGRSVAYSSFRISGLLVQRGMGLVYLIAFFSYGVQMAGLNGSQGILPVADHLEAIRAYLEQQSPGASAFWASPSLLWLDASDSMLNLLVWGGALFALLLVLGLLPGFSSLLCWACYLSLVNGVPVFLSFQWDMLLVEAGFILIFVAPWVLRERFSAPRAPSMIGRWLLWWLLFRLMFESGVVKMLDYPGVLENTWRELTALNFHYFTQPIPNNRSWMIHWMPDWFHQISIVLMLVIELVVPFLIFFPRRIKTVAAIMMITFQGLIIASGNYGFFNVLTIVLCLSLIDDQSWSRLLVGRLKGPPASSALSETLSPIGWIRIPLAALYLFFGFLQLGQTTKMIEFADYKGLDDEQLPAWLPLYESTQKIRAINYYGLFRVMTTTRPEIIIEGSEDLQTWRPYTFKYKPGALDRSPPWATPHMPRLDWQMWFAALSAERGAYPSWFGQFLRALSENRPEVTELLETNPFEDAPPKYIRVRLYEYNFTTPEQRLATGDTWQRSLLPSRTLQFRTDRLGQ